MYHLRARRTLPAVLAAAPAVVVIGAVLVAVAGSPWYLTGDFAHSELLVRAVPRHPPLVGVAARVRDFGSTPGPSMAYLLYPVYRLFGENAYSLALAVCVLHALAIAGVVGITGRLAGRMAALSFGVGLLLVVVALGAGFFVEPWNVWIPLFALPLVMVLVWAVSLDHPAALVPAVAIGSHCVQTHVGYTVIVAGLLGAAVAMSAVRLWRYRSTSARRRGAWLVGAFAAGLVAWLPPLVEQARPGTGNLRKVLSQFLEPGQPAVGVRAALDASAARLNLVGMWNASTAGDARAGLSVIGLIGFLVVVVPAVVLTVRRGNRAEVRWLSVLGLTTALGFVSASRVFGTFFEYVVRWMVPLAGIWLGTALWSYLVTARRRWPQAATGGSVRILAPVVAVTLALTAVGIAEAADVEVPHRRDSDLTAALSGQLREAVGERIGRGERFQLNEVDVVALGSVAFGIVTAFDATGGLGTGEWGRSGVQSFRVVDDEAADGVLWLVTSQRMIDHFAALPGATVVALADVRTRAEVERSAELEASLVRVLCTTGRADRLPLLASRWGYTVMVLDPALEGEASRLVSELIELRQVAAVIELPHGLDGFAEVVPPPRCP